MNHEELHRALIETEQVMPSSGFVSSVMDAVRQEAATTAPIPHSPMPFPPIPFPWKWALPGLIVTPALAVGMIFGWIYAAARAGHLADSAAMLPNVNFWSMLPHFQVSASMLVATEWSALGALVSVAAVCFSMRIARILD
ncbi:MAG: hypothetical protein ACRD28_10575 [Acidobacteriaceae bacterium]